MLVSPRFRFFLGLFLLTCSTLMIEIIQTRLLSVVTWYHLAFFVISSAMFGLTAGAVWVYRRRDRFVPERLEQDLADLTAGFALTTVLALVVQLSLTLSTAATATTVIVFAELAIVLALPFFFSGAAVSLALTRSPYPIGIVYGVDLAGAAVGCLGTLAALQWTDGPSAVIFAAALAALGALCFRVPRAGAAPARGWARFVARPGTLALGIVLLALANHSTRHGLQPVIVKDHVERRADDLIYEKWNSFSRVAAYTKVLQAPFLWGPSPRLPRDAEVEQFRLNIDGHAMTMMYRFEPKSGELLRYDLTNLAYFVRDRGRAAVVGVGSGRDILSAWTFGFRDITGVELNPILIALLQCEQPFAEFAGIGSLPGVKLHVDEARSWFARSSEHWDLLQMSMIDTWAATGAGAFTLTENGLYTVDAWEMFLSRLTDDGVFTVSRWYAPGEVNETGRLVSLATAALLRSGSAEPARHLYVAASGPIANLIASRSPWREADLARLDQACAAYGYQVLLRPGRPAASAVLQSIVTAPDERALHARTSNLDLDLTPPTDDQPFFFNILPLSRPHVVARHFSGAGVLKGNIIATLTLLTILIVSAALVTLTIVVPLRSAIRAVGRPLVLGGTAYFMLLGLGFMFAEIGMMQRLSVFLGHPVYALSVVLFGLIASTGAGSMISERWPLRTRTAVNVWALLTSIYLIALPFWLPAALAALQNAGLLGRALLSVAVIAPAGILMGFGFPTGMRIVQARDDRPTPWFWGINGAAGVLASVVAVAVSIAFGIQWTMILGGLCYLIAIPAAGMILSSGEMPASQRRTA